MIILLLAARCILLLLAAAAAVDAAHNASLGTTWYHETQPDTQAASARLKTTSTSELLIFETRHQQVVSIQTKVNAHCSKYFPE